MKKNAILGLLSLTSMVLASAMVNARTPGHACEYLLINIKNDTPFNCYVIKRTLKNGGIQQAYVYKVPSGTTSRAFDLAEGFGGINMTLTYECNEGRNITFNSVKPACIKGDMITGTILSTQNMDATFSVTPGSYWAGTPGIINWTFY